MVEHAKTAVTGAGQAAPSTIVLQLARNPDTPFVLGDRDQGYVLIAPLTASGHISMGGFTGRRWPVRRFGDEGDGDIGWLTHRGNAWFIDHDEGSDADDEPIYRLSDHRFLIGEYVTITGADGKPLTYRVAEVAPLN